MDFYQIKERASKNGSIEVYPDFRVIRSKDLMVRAKSFYAIWDEEAQLWSIDEYDVQRLVDEELRAYQAKLAEKAQGPVLVKLMSEFSTNSWAQFRSYLGHISDNSHQLDSELTFANTPVKKKDYVSRRLPYSLEAGTTDAYDELMSTLYSPDERAKLEWAIGSIVAGDSKDIQKFIVLYGEAGAGKSTFLSIVQRLFEGYYTAFEAKALTSSNNGFSTEVFRSNPLVAIQHDGDLSRIEDNTKLNSIISHEMMTMNEKYKPSYMARANCFLFMATNKPVRITDAKSGIIRRLIDVHPSGNRIPNKRYHELMSQIDFELGAIAWKCLEIYRGMGKNYYSSYRPLDMILQTDTFFNFVENSMDVFVTQGGVSLSQAYEMYKTYCDESLIEFKLPRHKFREELKNYFEEFADVKRVEGRQVRSYFSGLILSKFTKGSPAPKEDKPGWLIMDSRKSLLDEMFGDFPAQYGNDEELPYKKWVNVATTLKDLDTRKIHYVKLPENHIVIDFDLKDSSGKKSPVMNVDEASKWPPTYAEHSKSGAGVHLHYLYEGDVSQLSRLYSEGIEVKVFTGDASLRRKLTKCNNIPVATIKSGLPLKEEKKMINFSGVKNEKALRTLIKKNLLKEIHPATKPSIDFIYTILEEAYANGMHYDVSDLVPKIMTFALNSTNQADYCISVVAKMKFTSEEPSKELHDYASDKLVFFDVEVFPNLFLLVYKFEGEDDCVALINPKPEELEPLLRLKLVGFNNRRYDNHILYARYIGYDNEELYKVSSRIIGESRNALFAEAYNLSYTDVLDFSSKKQSLKKFQIELGIHHQELGLPWDKPIPEELWPMAVEYCKNDVVSLEAVFNDRRQDFVAREILSQISGLSVNHSTQSHVAKIVFGEEKEPQKEFVYTDLSEMFPGYKYEGGKSTYRGEVTGEGGYVYAVPGSYTNVALLDVASMHPTSIERLNLFGKYTDNYINLKRARLAIKHKNYDQARRILGDKIAPYLTSPEESDALSYALKIVINIVYGLTSASFPNKFRDIRNVDNIVAKRGALFMIDLKHAVEEQGYVVAHIKTDSIKIPDATPEIIEFVKKFGERYGYEFEHEATYDRFCLTNDAVYIARYANGKSAGNWNATGAQFAHPYVFKTLFSKEKIELKDLIETKSVKTALYLDLNENLGEEEHDYHYVGKAGAFYPIKPGCNGGLLLREKDGKYNAATGTKGYRWLEAEMVRDTDKADCIDMSYYQKLADDAVSDISKFVDFEWFVS